MGYVRLGLSSLWQFFNTVRLLSFSPIRNLAPLFWKFEVKERNVFVSFSLVGFGEVKPHVWRKLNASRTEDKRSE